MPFYFRRSRKVGPLRVTMSKSGISTSVGVKGARITAGPRGAYVSMNRYGAHYRQRVSSGVRPVTSSQPRSTEILTGSPLDAEALETTPVDELVDASSEDVLTQLNHPGGSWLAKLFRRVPPAELHYDLDDEAAQRFARLSDAIGTLSQAAAVWLLDTRAAADPKYHGGAGAVVNRHPIRVGHLATPGIVSNIAARGLDTGKQQLFFFPDHVLVRSNKRYGAVPYNALDVRYSEVHFREDARVPGDARIIGETWQYVNKSGGPDKRFKNNRRIPIALYGELRFTSSSGLQLLVQVSNAEKAKTACQLLTV